MLPHSLLLRMYNFVEIQFIKINFRHFKKTEGSIIHTIFLKKKYYLAFQSVKLYRHKNTSFSKWLY
jgi:hypothetical protein